MPYYRRSFVPGGSYFLTVVTGNRHPLFNDEHRIALLRKAIGDMKQVQQFEFVAAVVLPDHLHFLWSLPTGDADYPTRIGRMKVNFTHAYEPHRAEGWNGTTPREKRRESGLWQPRYWEHTIRDDDDLKNHLDYIHYNPVKHGYCRRPADWKWSSFPKWVRLGEYDEEWGLGEAQLQRPAMLRIAHEAGEAE